MMGDRSADGETLARRTVPPAGPHAGPLGRGEEDAPAPAPPQPFRLAGLEQARLERAAARGTVPVDDCVMVRWAHGGEWDPPYRIISIMSILKVARMGHPVLRAGARPLERSEIGQPRFQALIDDMIETMVEYRGVGLAAPHVYPP